MFSSRWLAGLAGVAFLAAAGWMYWQRKQELAASEGPGRALVAILPCDNQTGDEGLQALADGAGRVLQLQLEPLGGVRAATVGTAADAVGNGATHLLHLQLIAGPEGPALTARVESLATHKVMRQMQAPVKENWNPALRAAAAVTANTFRADVAKLASLPRPEALRTLMKGFASTDANEAAASFESAVGQDAGCGWCWVAWAETITRVKGAEAGKQAVARFTAEKPAVDAVSGARMELLDATFAGDAPRRVQALWNLAELRPGEAEPLVSLAQLAQQLHQYAQAEKALSRAVKLAPGQAEWWNTLAYAQASQGKAEAALKSVAEYERLAPGSPNPADSRGEILLMAGRFAEAEKSFLASAAKDADFNAGVALEKAALARLLSGDATGAGAVAGRYLEQRQGKSDALTPFHQARWAWLLGRRREALGRMTELARGNSAAATLAAARMAVWAMETGDETAAREWAVEAAKKSKRPGDQLAAAMVLTLAGRGAEVKGLPPAVTLELEALRSTLRGEFAQAAQAWKKVRQDTGDGDPLHLALSAWVELRAGETERAKKDAAGPWPILSTDQMLLFDSFIYQSVVYTRAELARESGQEAEARRLFDLYLRTMGDAKDRYGQMSKARGEARL